MLDGPLFKEDSITYGINFLSPLNGPESFHVVDNMPMDIMHVLFEGVLPYEFSLMIRQFISDDKLFTLDELNGYMQCFAYSSLETKDKPSLIRSQVLTGSNVAQSCEFKHVVFLHV